jgi:hypothetical protein
MLALALILSPSAFAQAESPRITGLYSNMRAGTEDLSGVEVFLVRGEGGYFATVQCAQGVPGKPVLVPALVSGRVVEFQLPADAKTLCPAAKFRGELRDDGLKGAFEGSDWPGFLTRSRSYWQ